jgi:hypothetical protein
LIRSIVSWLWFGQGFESLTGLPVNGSTMLPSSTLMIHWTSLSCWLSAMSPVLIANWRRAVFPDPGFTALLRFAFMLRTIWSKSCEPIASHGRLPSWSGEPASSRKSSRAVDISSASCGSVNWPKKISERRRRVRSPLSLASDVLRTACGSPGSVRRSWKPSPNWMSIVSSSVVLPAGSAVTLAGSASTTPSTTSSRALSLRVTCSLLREPARARASLPADYRFAHAA